MMADKTNKPKKERKPLTPTQRLRAFTIAKWTCFGGEFVSAIMPYVIIGLVNFNDYFVEYNGVKMSIAAVMTFALMGFVLFILTSKKIKDFYIPMVVIMATLTFIFFMLGQIITEVAYIMLAGTFGICGSFGLEIASRKFDKKAKSIKEAIEEANKELTKQEYIDEQIEKGKLVEEETTENTEKKTVKVRVKK